MRVRVKFCGITRVEDALAAARLGVDAVGLVFAERSPRRLTPEAARAIAAALPPFVARVALFMDTPAEQVRAVLDVVPIDLLQFHGREPAAQCAAFGRPWVKAIAMGEPVDLAAAARAYAGAQALLLDGHRAGEPGGAGVAFDWERARAALAAPVILAGGLTADNVARAIATARPWAVDVSSGIERAPGIKDHGRMRLFLDEVQRVRA